ncbi:MAG: peptide-methionine (S)-S-oxide reductase MsrA|nr:peptide-methionine (S)-S-oxide reductase MsrA [Candidatus Buchananbacteria bacterium]
MSNKTNLQKATFGAGCFWHVQQAFDQFKGVKATTVGFMGGHVKDPSYKQVSTGQTGHAEVCQVIYDPNKISYEQLLEKFWEIHDPTQLNQQGLDIGSQYRSVIFYHNQKQKMLAKQSKKNLAQSDQYKKEIVTEIKPVAEFYPAEEYHQDYYKKHKLKAKLCGF